MTETSFPHDPLPNRAGDEATPARNQPARDQGNEPDYDAAFVRPGGDSTAVKEAAMAGDTDPATAEPTHPAGTASPADFPSRSAYRKEKPKKPRGAGRNLLLATVVGAAMLAAFGLSLFLYKPLFAVVGAALVAACLIEFRHAIRNTDRHLGMPIVVVGGIGIFICAWQMGLEAMLTATFLTTAAALLWQLVGPYRGEEALQNVILSSFTIAYIPFLGSFVALLAVECGAPATAVFVLTVTLGSDTGGYFFGRFLGRHHMTPTISPNKTWEGFAGSVFMAVVIATAGTFWIGIPWFYGIILGVLMAVVGTLGDLSESLMKRELGIKDMGHLVPGHGGLLDRMDSILMTAPVAYLVLKFAIFSQQVPVLS